MPKSFSQTSTWTATTNYLVSNQINHSYDLFPHCLHVFPAKDRPSASLIRECLRTITTTGGVFENSEKVFRYGEGTFDSGRDAVSVYMRIVGRLRMKGWKVITAGNISSTLWGPSFFEISSTIFSFFQLKIRSALAATRSTTLTLCFSSRMTLR